MCCPGMASPGSPITPPRLANPALPGGFTHVADPESGVHACRSAIARSAERELPRTTSIKLGQMLSLRAETLSVRTWRRSWPSSRPTCPPTRLATREQTIKSDLGRDVSEAFSSFRGCADGVGIGRAGPSRDAAGWSRGGGEGGPLRCPMHGCSTIWS